MKLTSLAFFAKLKWLDGSPLLNHVEPYRRQLFTQALDSGQYNLVLAGRSKKNWKSADLCLAALYALVTDSPGGNQCYLLANDLDQAGDDLSLCKALVECNPVLSRHVVVKQKIIERRDGRGFLLILPAGDIAGSHGKTFRFCGWDEVHGYKSWDIFEALQPDPHRQDVLQWVTTYASLYHRPGVPLFDLFQQGKAGSDPKMLFSWYSGSYTTDPDLDLLAATAEEKANPSRGSWTDPDYLLQQQRRLPSHVYRRLHLCEPGLPSGSAYSVESIEDALARGIRQRPPQPGIQYYGFVDMSGGSNDDAAFGVAHLDAEGRALLDYVGSQGQRAPFDPRQAVGRFAGVCKQYGITRVYGDKYAGETFISDFAGYGLTYEVSLSSASQLYEAFEPVLNGHRAVLLDLPILEQQLLGLVWRGGKIDHPGGEHDDYANAAVGALLVALDQPTGPSEDSGEPEDDMQGIPAEEFGGSFLRGW